MNPDHEAILAFLRSDGRPQRLEMNELLKALGATLLTADKSGLITLGFEPDAQFIQGNGVVQGGIVAAMMDFAAAFSSMTMLESGRVPVTVNLNTSFLKACPAGPCTVNARIQRLGRSMAFARAEVIPNGQTQPVATANAVMMIASM